MKATVIVPLQMCSSVFQQRLTTSDNFELESLIPSPLLSYIICKTTRNNKRASFEATQSFWAPSQITQLGASETTMGGGRSINQVQSEPI